MAYTINYPDTNKGTIPIEDSTINQQTSSDIPDVTQLVMGLLLQKTF